MNWRTLSPAFHTLLIFFFAQGLGSVLLLVVACSALAVLSDPCDDLADRMFLPLVLAVSFLPLALSFGAGGAGSRSMGVALLGGFAFFAVVRLLLPGRAVVSDGRLCYNTAHGEDE